MTTESQDTGPLDWRIAITDKAGRPTPEFQRRWAIQRNNNSLIGSVTLGSGPPTSANPGDGAEYIDISTTPFTLYVGSSKTWHQVGVVKFTDLSDAPHSYSGHADALIQVNAGATGLQFIPISSVQSVGFSFYAGGLFTAAEELGSGVWPTAVHFDNTMASSIVAGFAATASAVMNIKMSGSVVGTITFAAGGTAGVLNWPSPVTVPIGTPLSLYAPTVADVSLSSVTGLINGSL